MPDTEPSPVPEQMSVEMAIAAMEASVMQMLDTLMLLPNSDRRLLAVAKTQCELGFLAAQRAVREP